MIIVFLGPPGCGKGTQSEFLVSQHHFTHISTGDLLRQEVKDQTELGRRIEELMATGSLVDDEIVLSVLKKALDFCGDSRLLLDGFPRTVDQAITLDQMLSGAGTKVDAVFNFAISHDQLLARITGRFVCATCGAIYNDPALMPKQTGVCDVCHSTEFKKRSDDTAQALSKRLMEFEAMTSPLKRYYQDKKVLMNLDAVMSVEQIREEISAYLEL